MKKSGLTLPQQGWYPGQKQSPTARPGVADGMDLWHGEGLRTPGRALGNLYGLASLIVISGTDCGPCHGRASVEYEGHTYYFCGKGCAKGFSADPGRYTIVAIS